MQPKTDAAQVHWTVVVMCTAASWLQSAPSRDTDRPRTMAMQSSASCSEFGRRRQAMEPAMGSRLADFFYVYEQVCITYDRWNIKVLFFLCNGFAVGL